VDRVYTMVGDIAVASREQASGVEGINGALAQLQDATQRNAAAVQQAAHSAMLLKDESAGLFELVSRFRLDDSGQAPAANAPVFRRAPPVPLVGSPSRRRLASR